MRRVLRDYVDRVVVVPVDGESVRGRLIRVRRDSIILASVEGADGASVDGLLIVPLPVAFVQVVG
jgi:hypothetical protein